MIEIKNISKSFKDKQVLFDISGTFEKGITNLIIGASGTGKSVLLKCLVGLLEPDVGSVLFDNRNFTNANKNLTTQIRREIGMLFQGSAVFDSKNVEENIKFPLEGVINGHYTKEHKKKDQIISQLTKGVPLIVDSKDLTPNNLKKYSVGDLITGYGVSESIIHYYNIYGGNHKNKRVIIQGWGNVASSTAYYLAQSGAKIVGIIDVNGGLINRNGV